MAKQPTINGKVVERSYEDYRNDLYLVNRRYQRKLVWGIEEKQAFIDSLANGYPVPLFLFSKSNFKGLPRHEIIDGMQRLNSIFSFIENQYPLKSGEYFDLTTTAITKDLLDKKKLTQKKPILDRTKCVKIVSYELPYSIYDESNPDIIDEVFRRINSNGQHLSRQEIRQAGAIGEFAQLVRSISTKIRGDVSHEDNLLLSQMSLISINKDSNAGIDPDSVFWVKENIISKEDLRQSMDEEQVADLLAAMLLSPPIPPSNVSVLNEYYGFKGEDSSSRYQKLEDAISAITTEKLTEQFFYVLDEIKKVFYRRSKTIIGQIVSPKTYKGPRYFQILFLSFYDLLIKQEKKIIDYDDLYNGLETMSKIINISAGGGWWSQQEKNHLIAATTGVLAPYFIERNESDPMYYSYTTELETLLKQSYTENSQYDFKQGIFDLDSCTKNDKLLTKIFKTLTAMANTDKNAVGYVILGVANKYEDAKKIQDIYHVDPIPVGNFYITGINGEALKYCKSFDNYFAMIKNSLKDMPIPEHYKRQIGSKMRLVNYHSQAVIILKIVSDNGAVMFDNNYYTRLAANNDPIPVSPEEMPAFFAKFS